MIQPFIPHLSEELWTTLGTNNLAINQSWPVATNGFQKKLYNVTVQINGKMKDIITLKNTPDEKEMLILLKQNSKIQKMINGKEIARTIYIPNKVINIVVKKND